MNKSTTKYRLLTALLTMAILLPQSVLAASILNGIEIHGREGTENIAFTARPGTELPGELTIRNSGRETAELKLYLHRAEINGQNFELLEQRTEHNDLINWISLGTEKIVLEAGAEKNVTFKIKIPENAAMGKHAGAIMASQRLDDGRGGIINLDTGIRIQATITGQPHQTAYKLINSRQQEENGKLVYKTTLVNKGNTILKGEAKLGNLTHGPAQTDKQDIRLQPGEEQKITLQTSRTPIGNEHIVGQLSINGELQTFVLKNEFRLPISELMGLLLFCSFIWLIRLSAADCKKSLNCPNCRKTHLAILLTITFFSAGVINGIQTQGKSLQTNIFGQDEQAYLTTIKWGNFTNFSTKDETVTAWRGQLSIKNGHFDEIEKLHNEISDSIQVNTTQDSINFQNYTGPDNDGIIVLVRAPSGQDMVLQMRNSLSGEEIQIPLSTTLKKARTINYKNRQIQITSEVAPLDLVEQVDQPTETAVITTDAENTAETTDDTETLPPIFEFASTLDNTILITDLESSSDEETIMETDLLTDLEATDELETIETETTEEESSESATSEITESETETAAPDLQQLMEEIKLLTGLIRELPASPDVISEYILNSDFISSITSDSSSTTIVGSSRLIRMLVETPLIIKEITATPDTNFLFLSNDRLKLGSQNFSFSERKSSSQEMNEMIFVQKRTTPWTVYFSITDLSALSGNGSISASNITFTPGTVNIVSKSDSPAIIEAGPERKLTGRGDLAKLFTVTPETSDESDETENNLTIFSVKPRLNIFIPPQTLPGLYRGEITFKAI